MISRAIFIPINRNPQEAHMNTVNTTEAARRVAQRRAGINPDPSPAHVRAVRLAAASPVGAPPTPLELEKIASIAAIVGTDPGDAAATLAACEALMAAYARDEAAARRQLSARERAMLSGMHGVSAVAYLARKRGAR